MVYLEQLFVMIRVKTLYICRHFNEKILSYVLNPLNKISA